MVENCTVNQLGNICELPGLSPPEPQETQEATCDLSGEIPAGFPRLPRAEDFASFLTCTPGSFGLQVCLKQHVFKKASSGTYAYIKDGKMMDSI